MAFLFFFCFFNVVHVGFAGISVPLISVSITLLHLTFLLLVAGYLKIQLKV